MNSFEGRYAIESVLGEGGMGTVYRATHTQMEKSVALKVLHGIVMADPQLRQRFIREIKSAAALDHPNIVKTLASGVTDDGRGWVAMELIEGISLSSILESEGKLPADRARPILLQLASALACAHEGSIIHRDIKPSNVMVVRHQDGSEQPMIVDFGLAKEVRELLPGEQSQTATAMQGSPLYMSPEQCEQKRTDSRSDIYAFGCLMHAILTGMPPFDGDSAFAVMFSHVHDEVAALPENTDVPRNLQSVMSKCLQKDPVRRFQNGAELFDALQTGTEIEALPARRKRLRLRILPVAVALLGSILIAMYAYGKGFESIFANESMPRRFAAFLDEKHLYSLESKVLRQLADILIADCVFPKPSNKKQLKALSFQQQEIIPKYWRLRIDAMEAALKANEPEAEHEARLLALELRNYMCAGVTGNEYFQNPIYDDIIIEWIRITKMIPNREGYEELSIEALGDVAESATNRAVVGNVPKLVQPAVEMTNLAEPLMVRVEDRRSVALAQFQLKIHFAFHEKNPQRKEKLLKAAEMLIKKELELWEQQGHYNDRYIIVTRAQFAECEYIRGNREKAAEIIKNAWLDYSKAANDDSKTTAADSFRNGVIYQWGLVNDTNFPNSLVN
jgi:hypothetical protein